MSITPPLGFDPDIDTETFLRLYVDRETWQELSGREILRQIRALGFKIGNERFGEVRREALEITRHQEQIQTLRPESLIPEAWVTEFADFDLRENYLYQMRVEGHDIVTGEPATRYMSLYDYGRLSIAEVGDIVVGESGRFVDTSDFIVENAVIERVLGRPDRFEL
jgi:hypothetical protein